MCVAREVAISRGRDHLGSLSFMIKFDESKLPGKVYIGFMSYEVRPYIPPPLRCLKWQKYGSSNIKGQTKMWQMCRVDMSKGSVEREKSLSDATVEENTALLTTDVKPTRAQWWCNE